MADVLFTVLGINETIASLRVQSIAIPARAAAALVAGAEIVKTIARANLEPHRLTGRAQEETTVGRPIFGPISIRVSVGQHYPPFNPEGYTFEFGWRSKSGKMPPPDKLAEWVVRRGISSQGQSAKQIGFLIARKIARRGYSFGTLHWLEDAGHAALPAALAIVESSVRL